MSKPLTREVVLDGLRYIIDSPPPDRGGFHPYAVKTAEGALALVERLTRERDEAMAVLLWVQQRTERAPKNVIRHRVRQFLGGKKPSIIASMEHKIESITSERDALRREVDAARAWDDAERPRATSRKMQPFIVSYRAVRAENEKREKSAQDEAGAQG